jgi:hypothetical protein
MKKYQSLIALAVVMFIAAAVTPVTAQQGQGNQTAQPPSETTSPGAGDTRSQTTSPSLTTPPDDSHGQSQSYNNPNDANAENPTRAETGVSWAVPFLTLLAGLAIGYFLGNRRPVHRSDVTEMRRDRDRVA